VTNVIKLSTQNTFLSINVLIYHMFVLSLYQQIKTTNNMEEYKGLKLGDKVKNKWREKTLQNCKIIEISENRLPLIKVIAEDGEEHFIPYMDIQLLNNK